MTYGQTYTFQLKKPPAFMSVISSKIATDSQQLALIRALHWLPCPHGDGEDAGLATSKTLWLTRGRGVLRVEVDGVQLLANAMAMEELQTQRNRKNAYGRHVSTLPISCLRRHLDAAAHASDSTTFPRYQTRQRALVWAEKNYQEMTVEEAVNLAALKRKEWHASLR